MREINTILLCGMGAIGSIYADKLSTYCPEKFWVLLDEERLKSYSDNPVVFNGKALKPQYILPSDKNLKADLIIISTKSDGLESAINNIKNFVYENTIIMSLLNGVTSEDKIAQKYGAEKLVYSYFIGHSSMRCGRTITQDGVGTIVFGAYKNNENVRVLQNLFEKFKIDYSIPDDILYSMWLKYMLNVSSNQVSAILHYNFGQILENNRCMDLMVNVMQEVQAIAKSEGVKNTDKMLDEALNLLNTMSKDGRTSMLQDIEAGRKPEIDIFAGTMIELGKKHNIQTPYNLVLKGLLECM